MTKGKNKKLFLKKVALGLGSVAIIAGSIGVARRVIDPGEVVTEVIDGDTFRISNKQTIRLFNVDAPSVEYCYGVEAKSALSSKILGKKVILKDVKTDSFRRIIANVYTDGEFINEYMSKNGFVYYTGDKASEFLQEASDFSRANKLGIFSETCSPSIPPKPNCNIKGQVQHFTDKRIYLLPGCRDYGQTRVERYRGEDWFCSEVEAKKAGFVKSSNCVK